MVSCYIIKGRKVSRRYGHHLSARVGVFCIGVYLCAGGGTNMYEDSSCGDCVIHHYRYHGHLGKGQWATLTIEVEEVRNGG